MSISFVVGEAVQGMGNPVVGSATITGDGAPPFSLAIPTGGGPHNVTIAFTLAQLKCLFIQSDQIVDLITNGGGDDTITLQANRPWHWEAGGYIAQPLSADVTSLSITNVSGETANVEIRLLIDATV